jgi:hypothetical protein
MSEVFWKRSCLRNLPWRHILTSYRSLLLNNKNKMRIAREKPINAAVRVSSSCQHHRQFELQRSVLGIRGQSIIDHSQYLSQFRKSFMVCPFHRRQIVLGMNDSPALGLRPSQNHLKVSFQPLSTVVFHDRLHKHRSPLASSCSSGDDRRSNSGVVAFCESRNLH